LTNTNLGVTRQKQAKNNILQLYHMNVEIETDAHGVLTMEIITFLHF